MALSRKKDIRIVKTYKQLYDAIKALLKRRSFNRITVSDLCEEAVLSRSAFYLHFKDKYALLASCLADMAERMDKDEIEKAMVFSIYNENLFIRNIIENADNETLDIVYIFMRECLAKLLEISKENRNDPNFLVFSHFIAGGAMQLTKWRPGQKPEQVSVTKPFFSEMLHNTLDWEKRRITRRDKNGG